MKRNGQKISNSIVKIGLTQMACSADPKKNLANQLRLVTRAASEGAQIVCTQELFRSQYFCQLEDHRFFKLAETIPGPSTDAFGKLARKHRIVIIASLFERRAAGIYHNTAAVIDADGSILGIYRKMHIPDDPLYYEKFYFTPGDTGFRSFQTKHARIGVLICWDQWFPEGARLTALQGAQILFYPTAIGWHPSERKEFGKAQHESWELIQRSHAVANGCFVCSPNRIGVERILDASGKPVSEDGIEFWGQSFVAAPNGQVIAKAPVDKEAVLIADCDLEKVEFSRTHWPFLRDRRIDAYGDMTKRFVGEHIEPSPDGIPQRQRFGISVKQELEAAMNQLPFISLRIHVRDGKKFLIRYPDEARFLGDSLLVFIGKTPGKPVAKSYDTFPFEYITRIERLPSKSTNPRRRKVS
jgi:N-carbamoylputrescine amidase